MKKTIDVSISGIAFVFDEPAYRAMNEYLAKLERGYRDNPDGGEIVADIEARIAEIILDKTEPEKVVDERLACEIIDRLGYPDEVDRVAAEPCPALPATHQLPPRRFSRRLYRNPDGAKFGGVCSGIATFFNIDPVWIRLAFIVPIVSLIVIGPIGNIRLSPMFVVLVTIVFLLYFILWFIVPKARTPRQRLEMHGEPITVSTIEQNFREDFSAKTTKSSTRVRKSASVWAEIVYVFGRIVLFALKAFAFLVGLAFAILSAALIYSLIIAIIWVNNGEMIIFELGMNPLSFLLVSGLVILVLLIPSLVLAWVMFRAVLGRSPGKKGVVILGIVWLIAVVSTGVIVALHYHDIRQTIENVDLDKLLIKERWQRIDGQWERIDERWEERYEKWMEVPARELPDSTE